MAQKETDGKELILPIWYDVEAADIREYSPTLADRIAAKWETGLENVVRLILKKIRSPKHFVVPYVQGNDHVLPRAIIDLFVSKPNENNYRGPINAFLDTGADISCLPKNSIEDLEDNLGYRTFEIIGIGNKVSNVKSYVLDIRMGSANSQQLILPGVQIIEINTDFGVIGRDILNNFNVSFNGPDQTVNIYT